MKKTVFIKVLLFLIIIVIANSCSLLYAFLNDDKDNVSSYPPEMPLALSANPVSSSEIDLSWTDNSYNELGFKIERSSTSVSEGFSQVAIQNENTNSYSDTGLMASTTYWYRIKAYNSTGNSDYTAIQSATTLSDTVTPAADPPAAPSGLSVTSISTNGFRLNWTDNSDNEVGFKIERSSTSDSEDFIQINIMDPDDTSSIDTGPEASTTYWYRVRAFNDAGPSAYSNVASGTTGADVQVQVPVAPSGLSASASGTTITLSWTDNSDNEDGFSIARGTEGALSSVIYSEIDTVTGNGSSYSDSGLTEGETYYYKVRAFNSAGNSLYSNIANAATEPGEQTITLNVQLDNEVIYISNDNSWQTTAFPHDELAVGINWDYNVPPFSTIGTQEYTLFQSLVKFNTSSLLSKTIDSAILHLTTLTYGIGDNPNDWKLRAMATYWDSSVTWNDVQNSDYWLDYETTHSPPVYSEQKYDINVTEIVQNWADGTWNNYGFLLALTFDSFPNADSLDAFSFYSSENSDTKGPKLEVVYY